MQSLFGIKVAGHKMLVLCVYRDKGNVYVTMDSRLQRLVRCRGKNLKMLDRGCRINVIRVGSHIFEEELFKMRMYFECIFPGLKVFKMYTIPLNLDLKVKSGVN